MVEPPAVAKIQGGGRIVARVSGTVLGKQLIPVTYNVVQCCWIPLSCWLLRFPVREHLHVQEKEPANFRSNRHHGVGLFYLGESTRQTVRLRRRGRWRRGSGCGGVRAGTLPQGRKSWNLGQSSRHDV